MVSLNPSGIVFYQALFTVSSQVAHGGKPISLLVRVSVTKYVESPRVPLSVMDA